MSKLVFYTESTSTVISGRKVNKELAAMSSKGK